MYIDLCIYTHILMCDQEAVDHDRPPCAEGALLQITAEMGVKIHEPTRKPEMGWLRLVSSLKLQVSFAIEPYKRDDILQKRPIILRSLLILATPYVYIYIYIFNLSKGVEHMDIFNDLGMLLVRIHIIEEICI